MADIARRGLSVAGAALAAAGILGVANAVASEVVSHPSHVSIHRDELTFSGRVTSPSDACLPQRMVTLYRTRGYPLGSIRTDARGDWKITIPPSAITTRARLYVRVGRSSQSAAGTLYVCRGARSETIRYRHE
jgi:hypothetical protein